MDPKLLEILKRAKQVDERAKKYDSVDQATLKSNVESRSPKVSTPTMTENVMSNVQPAKKNNVMVDVNSNEYKQKVKESKLPPEIQRAMLENPIPQADPVGAFSMDEEMIKQINPNYKSNEYSEEDEIDFMTEQRHVIRESVNNTQNTFDSNGIRKIIAEEVAKILPTVIDNYMNKSIIKENTRLMKVLLKSSSNK